MRAIQSRGAGRRRSFLLHGLASAGAAALLGAAAPALADDTTIADVVALYTPRIAVESNGKQYAGVAQGAGNIEGQIRVQLDAGVIGRVVGFQAWPRIYTLSADTGDILSEDFKGTGMTVSKSYSWPRPKAVTETGVFSIPKAHYGDLLVAACNAHAAKLRGAGQTDAQIFAQDRALTLRVTAGLDADISGPASAPLATDSPDQMDAPLDLQVICKRLPPRVPNPIADSNLAVRTAQLNNVTGACELHLHGTISTHEGNVQVKLRYVDAGGQQSDVKTVTTDAQGFVNFTHTYPLSAEIKSGKIRMIGAGPTFSSDWAEFRSECSAPPQDVATVLPPKAAEIIFGVREEVLHRGLFCPSVIAVEGLIEGRGKASGAAALFAGGQLKKLQQYTIEDRQSVLVVGEHALTWGPTQAQQSVKLAMNVTNAEAALVDQIEKTVNVTCRQVKTSGVGQGTVGGFSGGQQPETAKPAAGQLAAPQNLAIQAPQGLVRKGEIRLTGGTSNGKYTLAFLRKNGGGYVAVQSAQLPKQMTGLVASFPLKALTGGADWRLRACPLGGTPDSCATADFRLPRIGAAGAAGATGPQQEQPQGTPVFLIPGVAN